MKHFKVRVQYLNGIDFLFECDAVTELGKLAHWRVLLVVLREWVVRWMLKKLLCKRWRDGIY